MAEPSPYIILGLEPGAGPAAVEIAYRRLIKRYHPDRTGGDGARAAEINRAYQQLQKHFGDRGGRKRLPPVPFRTNAHRLPRRRSRWPIVLVVILALVMVANADSLRRFYGLSPIAGATRWATDIGRSNGTPGALIADISDVPLDSDGIDRSVVDAVRISREGEDRLVDQSRACHRQLRLAPSASRLDRCVAFDEAAVTLLGRDILQQSGPFGFSAVTARQLSAGAQVSNDSLAIESRLAQIRARVEMSLAPPDPQPMAAPRVSD